MNEFLKSKIQSLPDTPGVYQFLDKDSKIIYVGKAKSLKKRVKSYFRKSIKNLKTRLLRKHIVDLNYITVQNENDAFLLENILIKKHKPKYNIQLKDDKTYPWILITNEEFPRILFSRNINKDCNEYYGPFTSTHTVNLLLNVSKKVFKIRTCKLKLNKISIEQKAFKPCLQFYINNCDAPCIGKISQEDYQKKINYFRAILKGKVDVVARLLKQRMYKFSKELNFERAQVEKENIDILSKFINKTTVINSNRLNVEVYSIFSTEKYAYVNMIKVIEGKLYYAFSTEIKKRLNESDKEILKVFIFDVRNNYLKGIKLSDEIITSLHLNIPNLKVTVPKVGIKNELLKLSEKNLNFFVQQKNHEKKLKKLFNKNDQVLEDLFNDLKLRFIPKHIECFDNSNIQGTFAVSSCVVFKNAKPSKKDYRKYNIKSVKGINDYETIYEVVYRRYKRLLDEKKDLPNLIIVDGGKGQLKFAIKALKDLQIYDKVDIVSIAKRYEEVFKPDDDNAIYLDKRSTSLKLLQQIRDEAHRFAVTFHRLKRAKSIKKSSLDNIKGIGKKTKQKLLHNYKSFNNIKNAQYEELAKLIGKNKADILINFLKSYK